MISESHVTRDATPLEAAKIMAETWCNTPVDFVDVWGYEWLNKEFIDEFLNICKKHGYTLKALKIKWIAHNCPGGEYDWCTNDIINQWIIEWVVKQISWGHGEIHEILVRSYRKMFQFFTDNL